MPLLGDRTDISSRTPMPVTNTSIATKTTDVSAEGISFTDGVAGTTQKIKLAYNNVLSEYGEKIGVKGDTSLSFGTGTVLTTEKVWVDTSDVNRLAKMGEGDYMVDYENGLILGKSATITSTSTDTVNYKVKLQDIADVTIEAGDIQIGAIEIKDSVTEQRASVDSDGALLVKGLGSYLEDTAHTSTDRGTFVLVVRKDLPVTMGADGDYVALITDSSGRLHVTDGYTSAIKDHTGEIADAVFLEDSIHTDKDRGMHILAVRNDTLATLAGADGDYAPFQVNADGALFVKIDGTVTVDTELPAAGTLGDAMDNPATPLIGSCLMGWDITATKWERLKTDEAGVLKTQNTPITGVNPATFNDNSFTTGEGAVVCDINAALSRNARSVSVAITGAGSVDVEYSFNGSTWATAVRLTGGSSIELTDVDIDSVRVTAVATTAYAIVAY